MLVLDLHLLPSGTLGSKQHFGHLAQLLEQCISYKGGPFALILWTEHEEEFVSLIKYLDSANGLSEHSRPVAYGMLSKAHFLCPDEEVVEDHAGLIEEIENALQIAPQLKAIFAWERDVQSAIRSMLASMLELIPKEKRTSQLFPHEVETLLSRLAIKAVGEKNVCKDPRAALDASLVPILADKISNARVPEDLELWRSVIKESSVPSLPSIGYASLNRMLHVALPKSDTIRASDWGSVVEIPNNWNDEHTFETHFGLARSECFNKHFKIPVAKHDQCRAMLVRIGAPCDYAQQRAGPITFLLALEVPDSIENCGTPPNAIWTSPLLSIEHCELFSLRVSVSFPLTVTLSQISAWSAVYRLRGPLLMELLHKYGTHSTRPGKISFE